MSSNQRYGMIVELADKIVSDHKGDSKLSADAYQLKAIALYRLG